VWSPRTPPSLPAEDGAAGPEQEQPFVVQTLELEAVQRARHAAAAGDRTEVALGLTEPASIDAPLTPRCIAHLVRERPRRSGLTVLASGDALWTFRHVAPDEATVRLDRPSLAALREQLAELWAT
jgi:hypothetical protein